jgi:hypothetical protein
MLQLVPVISEESPWHTSQEEEDEQGLHISTR